MIIVNLKGGLGNQMFQYALGRKLSLLNGTPLKLDTQGLARAHEVGDIYRPFALDAFSIRASIASKSESVRLRYPYGILSRAVHAIKSKVFRQAYVGWVPSVLKKRGDAYLDGYFQSPKYFEDIRGTLLEEFRLSSPPATEAEDMAMRMRKTSSVSVHIRRGDYVATANASAYHGPLTPAYYTKVIKRLRESVPDATWFVFSDDVAWVQENLSFPGDVVYVSGNGFSDQEEMILMSSCKHNILANSSFSWWGAWLNQNPEKIVLAPDPWLDNATGHEDLIPESWIRIPKY